MNRSTLAVLLLTATLAGCATRGTVPAPAPEPVDDATVPPAAESTPPPAPSASPQSGKGPVAFRSRVVQVDVTEGLTVVSSGLGYWIAPGVVLTSLHAVNSVPPTGGLVVRADGESFNASTWAGGNRTDLDAAILFVHEREKQGELPPLLEPCADGIVLTPEDRLLTPAGPVAVPSTMDPKLSGATVYSASGDCRLGVLSSDPATPSTPRITPISAQAILEKALPDH